MSKELDLFRNFKEIQQKLLNKDQNNLSKNMGKDQLEEYLQAQKLFKKNDITLSLLARPGDSYTDSEGTNNILSDHLYRIKIAFKNKVTLQKYLNTVNNITLQRFYNDRIIDQDVELLVKGLDKNVDIQIKPIDISVDQ